MRWRKCRTIDLLLEEIFDEYDAILTPATPGPAPAGLGRHRQPGDEYDLDLLRHACDQCSRFCKAPRACRSASRWWVRKATMRACFAARAGYWIY